MTAENPDYYEILGIPRDATHDQIKRAKRILAAKHHPDRGGDTTEMAKINKAYEVLSDPEKRALYDLGGEAAISSEEQDRQLAREKLASLVRHFLSSMVTFNVSYKSLKKDMKEALSAQLRVEKEHTDQTEKTVLLLEREQKRFTSRSGEPTIYEEIVLEEIQRCRAHILQGRRHQKISEMALAMLKEMDENKVGTVRYPTDILFIPL